MDREKRGDPPAIRNSSRRSEVTDFVREITGRAGKVAPGLLLSGAIAIAASLVSKRLGGGPMVYALLFGVGFNFLGDDDRVISGVHFASRVVLRLGVALLGLHVTTAEILDLGWAVVVLVVAGVMATILAGWAIGRFCGLGNGYSLLSACAVSICGASAALAIASALPRRANDERDTTLTVATVTALSTIAMFVYPIIVDYIGFDNRIAGVFLGATIHDVAQVVGAGYIVSEETAATATIVKLLRVACLAPVVIAISAIMNSRRTLAPLRQPPLPWFLIAFVMLVISNNLGFIPTVVGTNLGLLASACLVTAMAGLGMRTSPTALFDGGSAPMCAMVLQTIFLTGFVLIMTLEWLI